VSRTFLAGACPKALCQRWAGLLAICAPPGSSSCDLGWDTQWRTELVIAAHHGLHRCSRKKQSSSSASSQFISFDQAEGLAARNRPAMLRRATLLNTPSSLATHPPANAPDARLAATQSRSAKGEALRAPEARAKHRDASASLQDPRLMLRLRTVKAPSLRNYTVAVEELEAWCKARNRRTSPSIAADQSLSFYFSHS
jgi:hypothetical protein